MSLPLARMCAPVCPRCVACGGSGWRCANGAPVAPGSFGRRTEVQFHSALLARPRHRARSDMFGPSGTGAVRASAGDDDPLASSLTTSSESEKDVLAAKLAAAEAEAEVLKKELASRRAGSQEGDLGTPASGRRIDGTGYRERMFLGEGKAGKREVKKWGITEAELFLSKGAPTEGSGFGGPAMEEGAGAIITRRLGIGLGLSVAVLALAFIQLPISLNKPSKPLFFYLAYILQLKSQLDVLEGTASDAKYVEKQLKAAIGSRDDLKDNFLSVVALLDGGDADRASRLAFDIFGYLNQADYRKYFESLGDPTPTQEVEFLQFSLNSIMAAREKMKQFLALVPAEDLQAAKSLQGLRS